MTAGARRGRSSNHTLCTAAALALTAVLFVPAAGASPGLDRLTAGDVAGAERILQDAVRRDPGSAESHFHLGLVRARQGRDDDAVARFDRALALDPELPGVQLSRGISLHRLGRHRNAEGAFEAALRQEPGEPSALLFLGLARIALGEYDGAVAPLREAARRDPELAQLALHNLGLAQWKAGASETAVRTFDEAIALDPNSETANDSRQLRQLAQSRPAPSARRWSLAGSIGFQYDDNVSQEEVDATTGSDDVLGTFEFSPAFRLVDNDRGVVEVGYDMFRNIHDSSDGFDLESHGVYLDASTELGPVDAGIAYRFDHSRLGGDRFLEIHGLRPSLGFTVGSRAYVDVGYQVQKRDFAADRRDAEHHDGGFDAYVFFGNAQGYVTAGYRVTGEDADGSEFDFLGHSARVGVRTPLPLLDGAFAGLRYEYTIRDYDEVTPSIGSRRDDRRHTVRLGLEKRIRNGMIAKLDYEFAESNSNLPSVDYTQNTVGMSLDFDF
jgi:tetratricopeptide (TPR) repeat protein